ncbi:MAG: hypothetical protein ACK5WQ_03195 [Alphaproteobacteria bacterium]|jgi:hypothetical protein|nr:hypothetical protein [Rickettsiales bacterium]
MIAFLSAFLGFASSILPEFFKQRQDARDKAHELALLEKQAALESERAAVDLDKSIQAALAAQAVAVQESYRADVAANKASWVSAYSASVRPTITYAFFLLYALVKFSQFWLLLHPSLPWQTSQTIAAALAAIWNDEDIAIFSAVIAFWFGDRMLRHRR